MILSRSVVMGAELAALVWVEAAFEEGAEDRGVDVGPVELGGLDQVEDVGLLQWQGSIGVEKAAIEPFDLLEVDSTALAHGSNSMREFGSNSVGSMRLASSICSKSLSGRRPTSSAKHAEDQAVYEMGDCVGSMAPGPQALGQRGEALRGLFV